MAKLAWGILCARVIVDQATNNVTLVDVIEEVQLVPPPGFAGRELVPVDWRFVALFKRDDPNTPERGFARFLLYGPDGKKTAQPDGQIPIDLDAAQRCRSVATIPMLPVSGFGLYRIAVEFTRDPIGDWSELGSVDLFINVLASMSPPPPSAAPRDVTSG